MGSWDRGGHAPSAHARVPAWLLQLRAPPRGLGPGWIYLALRALLALPVRGEAGAHSAPEKGAGGGLAGERGLARACGQLGAWEGAASLLPWTRARVLTDSLEPTPNSAVLLRSLPQHLAGTELPRGP